MLTQEKLKELLEYNPKTGLFLRKVRTSNRININDVAGCYKESYIAIRVLGKTLMAHRLAWLYMTGSFPNGEIDHIDLDKSNNKWENLREVNHAQNMLNQPIRKNNSSSFNGVHLDSETDKWCAQISINGKRKKIGRFNNIEDAIKARKEAEIKHYGKFCNLNSRKD